VTGGGSLKRYLFNLYFYPVFLLSSAVAIPLLTLFVAVTRLFLTHRATMKRFRRAIAWYGRLVMSLPYPFIRIRYERAGDVAPGAPYIFVCNHRSTADPFLMGVLPHELVQTVNIWPFRIPVLGIYAKFSGYMNIRMMPPERFLAEASRLLTEGVSIVFFPEGTRAIGSKMGNFNGAAFRLALATKSPIVPLCISGSETVMPKGSSLLRPGTIRVRRLPAITWSEYMDTTAFALKNRVWKIIDGELAAMEGRA
jgi:1-acyl-sn-glycerol-3-phosphate acyltransferase